MMNRDAAGLDKQNISIELANSSHIDDIHHLLQQTTAWLEANGIRQWPYYRRDWVAACIDRREVYIATCRGEVKGSFRLVWRDPDVWGDDSGDAGYVHTLAVRRDYSGQQLGQQLLAWAEQYVAEQGKTFLRLDCIVENRQLRRYDEERGFSPAGQAQAWGRTMQHYQKSVRMVQEK